MTYREQLEASEGAALHLARVPPRYEHCSLANFDGGNASLRAALQKAMSYSAGYPHLGAQEGASIRPTRPIRYRVGVKELTGVGVSGSADVQARPVRTLHSWAISSAT